MAHQEKRKVSLNIAGETYTLVLDTAALVALEDLFSTPEREVTFVQILQKVERGSIRYIRAFIWAALQRHHKHITIDQAGELIDKAGGIAGLAQQVTALQETAVPDKADVVELGAGRKGKGPPKAQAKTKERGGAASTSTLDRSA